VTRVAAEAPPEAIRNPFVAAGAPPEAIRNPFVAASRGAFVAAGRGAQGGHLTRAASAIASNGARTFTSLSK